MNYCFWDAWNQECITPAWLQSRAFWVPSEAQRSSSLLHSCSQMLFLKSLLLSVSKSQARHPPHSFLQHRSSSCISQWTYCKHRLSWVPVHIVIYRNMTCLNFQDWITNSPKERHAKVGSGKVHDCLTWQIERVLNFWDGTNIVPELENMVSSFFQAVPNP